MNVQLPPKQPCSVEWPRFVQWMEHKMMEDSSPIGGPNDPDPIHYEILFRGHKLTYCPFCGAALDMERPILARHP